MYHLTYTLQDGRQLGYALYGPANGQPVLYFNGTPSSRLEPLLLTVYGISVQELLHRYNIHLIAVDRPGTGLSTFDEHRSYTSFAADVHQLLQHLQIPDCAVMCWSGGGPYALTMAYQYPQLIKGVYIIAGFSTSFAREEAYGQLGITKFYFGTARNTPGLLKAALRANRYIKILISISQKLYELSNADYKYMKPPALLNGLMRYTTKEACRYTAKGAVQEARLYFKHFPYRLSQIHTYVHFWWGTDDTIVTYIHAKEMERHLPNVTPHYKPKEGHLSIYLHYFEEVLQTIAKQA